ncbi:MAG: helix-turn-helix domain-containing protein [Synergistaceae bacterium]|jgi:ribosome-binding protein aMBF1 (putative translation factor)|nr:helix-turn-helix domain-containing protein [Synergistaceae bacterium]
MNFSQGELAAKVDVSKTAIFDWEKEHYVPTDATNISALEQALGFDSGYLYNLIYSNPLLPLTQDEQVPSLESGEKTRAEIGGVIEAGLKAWKESREAVEAMRPEILADGVSYEEAVVIDTEASEVIRSLEILRERLKGILRVA